MITRVREAANGVDEALAVFDDLLGDLLDQCLFKPLKLIFQV